LSDGVGEGRESEIHFAGIAACPGLPRRQRRDLISGNRLGCVYNLSLDGGPFRSFGRRVGADGAIGKSGQELIIQRQRQPGSFCFDLQKSVVIPDSKFLSASDFLDEEGGMLSVGAGKDVNYVKLESPRWTYVSKLIEGNYPNWKQVVPKPGDKATKIVLNDAALKQLQAVAPKLPGDNEQDRPVRLRFDSQSLFIEARSRDEKEWTSICVQEAVGKGRTVAITLNREYLLKAARFGLR
jgi:DNA polymerase III subunit beta